MIDARDEPPIQERRASSLAGGSPLARLRWSSGQLVPAAASVGGGGGSCIRGHLSPRGLLGGRHPSAGCKSVGG